MKIKFILLLTMVSVLSALPQNRMAKSDSSKSFNKINGVAYVAPRNPEPTNPFAPMEEINANWVCIMPYAFCSTETPVIQYNNRRQWWGERSEGVIRSIELAREKGMKIMLKPHVWVRGQGWTGDFYVEDEKDWGKWEESYAAYLVEMAQLADSLDVELFCVGLEFKNVIDRSPNCWPTLIKKVKKVYDGPLTYGANWDNFENITFWDQLDYIGVHAYFPLSDKPTPSVGDLMKAWQEPYNRIKKLQKKYKKPILFTEYGYRSIDKAAGKQWELPGGRRDSGGHEANTEVQKNAYEAFYQRFWKEPWIAGGFFWKWHGKHDQAGGKDNIRFTPQNKPAQETIKEWYGHGRK